MKAFLILRVFFVLSIFFMGIQFTGCGDDESIPTPIAGFNFSGTNDFNAPTTVSFENVSQHAETYSWNFGNGETSTEVNPSVIYSEEGTYTVQLTASGEGGSHQASLDIIVGPLVITAEKIVGTWSIIREEITMPGSTTPMVKEKPMNWSTLMYQENGNYERISLDWVEYETGTYAFSNNSLTMTPTGGNDDFSPVVITITSVSDTEIEAEADMNEPGVGTIHLKVNLKKLGSEYYGVGTFPIPSVNDFAGTKWSILDETTKVFIHSSTTNDYTELVSTQTDNDIPYNYNTFLAEPGIETSLFIDNWGEGKYERYYNLKQIRTHTLYWVDAEENGDEFIILITNNLDGNNIETTSVGFVEENGVRVKFESITKLQRSDGTEATITESDWTGQWKVMDKTEKKDGANVDPMNSDTPPLGFVMTFHSDGSADIGDVNPGSWFALDDSNYVVVSPDGHETLVHITDWTAPNLSTFSRWKDQDDSTIELTMTLEKQ